MMNYEDDLNHGLATLVMGWTLGNDPRASRYMGEGCSGTMIRLLPGEVRPENSWDYAMTWNPIEKSHQLCQCMARALATFHKSTVNTAISEEIDDHLTEEEAASGPIYFSLALFTHPRIVARALVRLYQAGKNASERL